MLHADSSAYFGLNQTATVLWAQLAQRPMTVDQLADWAREYFPGAPADLDEEIAAFIEALQAQDLILAEDGSVATVDAIVPRADLGAARPWETPSLEGFGELEKLILSGE